MRNAYLPLPWELLAIERETAIDSTFVFRRDHAVHAAPTGGQFMEVSLPGIGEAPISISDFDDTTLRMTIRRVGRLTDGIFGMKPGDVLHMRGPYGNGFDPAQFRNRSLVVIAGGTGLAPVKSLIRHFVRHPEERTDLELILGFKTPDDILFRGEIEQWRTTADVCLSVDTPAEGWQGKTGLVTTHIPSLRLENAPEKVAVVVGPPVMMKFTTLELLRHGFREENLWVSFERRMSCGLGKCGHCKIDETYVCLDGPVFPYVRAKRLLD